MKIINENEFKELVEQSSGVTVVDFFATWCGPCKMLAPILEQVESENIANIYKVDVDESFELAKSFGIMSVPTILFFKDGELKEKQVGLRQKHQIIETINLLKN